MVSSNVTTCGRIDGLGSVVWYGLGSDFDLFYSYILLFDKELVCSVLIMGNGVEITGISNTSSMGFCRDIPFMN